MKSHTISLVIFVAASLLVGCGSEQAPGYDAASKDAAEALAKNGNDITKLTPEQKSALERVAGPPHDMRSTSGGGGAAPGGTTG